MKDDLRIRFDNAVKLREEGDFASAKEMLLQLRQDDPQSPAILTVLADVCWDMKHLDEAIALFQQAAALSPNSETVSLGLFHCLWEADRTDDAFREMKRFLANNESDEYTQILADINDN